MGVGCRSVSSCLHFPLQLRLKVCWNEHSWPPSPLLLLVAHCMGGGVLHLNDTIAGSLTCVDLVSLGQNHRFKMQCLWRQGEWAV